MPGPKWPGGPRRRRSAVVGGRASPARNGPEGLPEISPGREPGVCATATTPRRGGTILIRMNRSEDQRNVIDVPCTANLESFCGPRTFIPPPRLGVSAGISRLVAPLPPHVVSSIYSQGNASGDGRRRERTVRDTTLASPAFAPQAEPDAIAVHSLRSGNARNKPAQRGGRVGGSAEFLHGCNPVPVLTTRS